MCGLVGGVGVCDLGEFFWVVLYENLVDVCVVGVE